MRHIHGSGSVVADPLSTKTLLVVGNSFFPNNTPRANRWNYFCHKLQCHDWRIRVVSHHFEGDLLITAINFPKPVQCVPSLGYRVCRKVFSVFIFEYEIIWALRRLLSISRKINSYKEIEIVIAYGLPLSGIILGAVLARLLGRPLVIEYGDPIDKNAARKSTLLERIANKWVMRRANRVLATNENYAKYATQVYGRKVECLLPIAPLLALNENEQQIRDHFARLGKNMKFFYAGTFYKNIRSGDPFIKALGCNKDEILFMHAGKACDQAAKCARYYNIGYIDQMLVPHYLYWADIVLYFSNDSDFQTPSKIVETAYLAKYVLAIGDSFSEFEKNLLKRTQTVYVSNKSSVLEKALSNIALKAKVGSKNSADFQKKIKQINEYNAKVVAKLNHVLNDCIL